MRVVLATIVGHGAREDERWQRAATALPIVDALTQLAEHPDDADGWMRAIRLFVERGHGMRAWALVKAASHIGEAIWEMLVVALLDVRDVVLAMDVARDGSSRFPRGVQLWAMRAILATELGELTEADEALATAAPLGPDEASVWFARSRLAWARGDKKAARETGMRAIELGAPREVVEAGARAAHLLWLLQRGA